MPLAGGAGDASTVSFEHRQLRRDHRAVLEAAATTKSSVWRPPIGHVAASDYAVPGKGRDAGAVGEPMVGLSSARCALIPMSRMPVPGLVDRSS